MVVISIASVELAHFYEVVLHRIETETSSARPALSTEDIDRILDIADEIDAEFIRDDEPADMIGGHQILSKKLH